MTDKLNENINGINFQEQISILKGAGSSETGLEVMKAAALCSIAIDLHRMAEVVDAYAEENSLK